jgi:plasmid stabilization system protein ParE
VRRARFLEPAKLELLAEVAYYNAKEPGLGQRFLSSVQEVTARALSFPLTGSPATQNTRRMFLRGFPFAIVYRPDEEGVVIIALAHHSRRPGYWRERAPESSQH